MKRSALLFFVLMGVLSISPPDTSTENPKTLTQEEL